MHQTVAAAFCYLLANVRQPCIGALTFNQILFSILARAPALLARQPYKVGGANRLAMNLCQQRRHLSCRAFDKVYGVGAAEVVLITSASGPGVPFRGRFCFPNKAGYGENSRGPRLGVSLPVAALVVARLCAKT
jgi:hypothetical protein